MSRTAITTEPYFCSHLPDVADKVSSRWLGSRLFCIPPRLDGFQRVSIASSRLSKRLDQEAHWFRYLRAAFRSCHWESTLIPVIQSTAGSELVARACELFGFGRLHVRLPADDGFDDVFRSPDERASWSDYCRSFSADSGTSVSDGLTLFVSPQFLSNPTQPGSEPLQSLPLADRLLFLLAHRICVLSMRSGGTISRLVTEHFADRTRCAVPLLIATNSTGRFPGCLRTESGPWIPWRMLDRLASSAAVNQTQEQAMPAALDSSSESAGPSIVPVPIDNPVSRPENWLCHWTRSTSGQWPGEAREEYIDQLILDDSPVDRSARATLLRIISEQRIRASTQAIRGAYEVAAFTEVPLAEFRSRRIFRSHRQRYDFEPWGIAIRRDVLQQLGGRPVLYGTEAIWNQLSASERPFFQKTTPDGVMDTAAEREWRIAGDLKLDRLPAGSVCVFVPTGEDVLRLQPACEHPICVVPENRQQ